MTDRQPVLYFDLGSPYAYLAVERAERVLGVKPQLEPILLGAIFQRRGFGSWAHTEAREERIADIEDRAQRYGVPPLVWPAAWPPNGLAAMRAATWAKQSAAVDAFARSVFRKEFAAGADLADCDVLASGAREAGLDREEMLAATRSAPVKQQLREATDAAWAAGVRGVPTLSLDGDLFYGDDRLEEAARARNSKHA